MEIREHPSHHKFLKLLNLGMFAVGAGSFFAIRHLLPSVSFEIAIVIPVAVLLPMTVALAYHHMRSCTCPDCGKKIKRDAHCRKRQYDYTCEDCGVRWVVMRNISRLKDH